MNVSTLRERAERAQKAVEDPVALLDDHRRRKIRAFLDDRRLIGTADEVAFWHFVYRDHARVEHETAVNVAAELERATATIDDLVEGRYKPEALKI